MCFQAQLVFQTGTYKIRNISRRVCHWTDQRHYRIQRKDSEKRAKVTAFNGTSQTERTTGCTGKEHLLARELAEIFKEELS